MRFTRIIREEKKVIRHADRSSSVEVLVGPASKNNDMAARRADDEQLAGKREGV